MIAVGLEISSVVNEGKMSVVACLSYANQEKKYNSGIRTLTACTIIATTSSVYCEITRAKSENWTRRRMRKSRGEARCFLGQCFFFFQKGGKGQTKLLIVLACSRHKPCHYQHQLYIVSYVPLKALVTTKCRSIH